MARKRIVTVLLIAMTVGAMFAMGTYRYVKATPATSAQSVDTTKVVVAASNMDLGTALRAEDLRVIDWPAEVGARRRLPQERRAGRARADSAGRRRRAAAAGKLASPEAGAGLPPVIPEGMRALSVRVNDVIGVAGYVLPGTRVDVLVTVSPTDQHNDMTSKLILTNVQVLTAGTQDRARRREGQAGQRERRDPARRSRTGRAADAGEHRRQDSARPAQSARQDGAEDPWRQARRPAGECRRAGTSGERRCRHDAAAPAPAAAAPSAAPAAAPVVEIIRGDKRAQEVVRQE